MTYWKSLLLASALVLAGQASAHGGHEDVPEGEAISGDPIVSSSSIRCSEETIFSGCKI
jgi:hypothetical protein